jgi:hypothetical protein
MPDGFVASDVYRKRIVANAEQARKLLAKMETDDLLQCQRIPSPDGAGGWISERYFLIDRSKRTLTKGKLHELHATRPAKHRNFASG